MSCLFFERLKEPVFLEGAPFLSALFQEHFQLWPCTVSEEREETNRGMAEAFLLHVREAASGFEVLKQGAPVENYDTPAELLCDIGIELAEAFVGSTPGLQCLHCSAVEVDGRLVVFPNVNRAGKSLLAANMLLQGGRVFADDLLGVTEKGEGVSFGLPPRLRLPLPSSSPRLAAELQKMSGISDERYRFLYAGPEKIASFGEVLPIGAVVLPRRKAGVLPSIRRLSASAGLQCMAYQFQMEEGQAGAVFELARSMCERLPLWLLEYDSPEDASVLLMAEAGRLFSLLSASEEVPPLDTADFLVEEDRISCSGRTSFPRSRSIRWKQADGVRAHACGASLYLLTQEQDAIFYVDGIGPAIWALLAEGMSMAEAADLLKEAFPQVERKRLDSDLFKFFRVLYRKRLIMRASC